MLLLGPRKISQKDPNNKKKTEEDGWIWRTALTIGSHVADEDVALYEAESELFFLASALLTEFDLASLQAIEFNGLGPEKKWNAGERGLRRFKPTS